MTVFLSAIIDEAGIDGKSDYAVAAGGVAMAQDWNRIEMAWDRLMERNGVKLFHSKEFKDRKGYFENWSQLKCNRFIKHQEKIIRNNLLLFAVAVNRKEHAEIKKQMRGIKGFKADSDVGICFRILRFIICNKLINERPDIKISFIVEDGPFSSDMAIIYKDVIKTIGAKYRPAKHAELLNGFSSVRKGGLRSLEIADYLAGQAVEDIKNGVFTKPGRPEQISMLATPNFLRQWHQDMIKERKKRKNFGSRSNLSQSFSKKNSSK